MLIHAAKQQMRREGIRPPFLAARVMHWQKRGVEQPHFVVAGSVPAIQRFFVLLSELAPHYGFGYVDRKVRVRSGEHAANYLAGYVTRDEQFLHATDGLAGDLRRVFWVNPTLTANTGFTMETCRKIRAVYREVMPHVRNGRVSFNSWALVPWADMPPWIRRLGPFFDGSLRAALQAE